MQQFNGNGVLRIGQNIRLLQTGTPLEANPFLHMYQLPVNCQPHRKILPYHGAPIGINSQLPIPRLLCRPNSLTMRLFKLRTVSLSSPSLVQYKLLQGEPTVNGIYSMGWLRSESNVIGISVPVIGVRLYANRFNANANSQKYAREDMDAEYVYSENGFFYDNTYT